LIYKQQLQDYLPINVVIFGLKGKYYPKIGENGHFAMLIAFELLNQNL